MNIVRELRKKKGIQQKELALILGVAQPTISEWEANKKDPSGERLRKLSEYFGVDELVILGKGVVDLNQPGLFIPEDPNICGISETDQIKQYVLEKLGVTPIQTPEITAVSGMMSQMSKHQQDQIVAIVRTFLENSPESLYKEGK